MAKTFARWATEVPQGFQFTVKLWKGITHAKGLQYAPIDIDSFMQAASFLGDKKGCLLIQFPASITVEYADKLASILARVKAADPESSWRIAVELRHMNWYNPVIYSLLDTYNASLVLHDMPASKPAVTNKKAPFIFLRFHGEAGDYRGSYSPRFLHAKARQIKSWLSEGRDVYAYFNNTIGAAYDNARTLQQLVNKRSRVKQH
jgi:uncharacterized protein YecE (DUF72 family)